MNDRLRALAERAAQIEEQTRAALAVSPDPASRLEIPDETELRFAIWRRNAEREFAARLAAALAERDLAGDTTFRVAADERLAALEESVRDGDQLRAALTDSEEKRYLLQAQVESLEAACHERLVSLESTSAAADALRATIAKLTADNALLSQTIEQLRSTCDERLAALEALHTEYVAVRAEAETRAKLIAEFHAEPAPKKA